LKSQVRKGARVRRLEPFIRERKRCQEADHGELLGIIRRVKGKVLLRGSPNSIYDRALTGWTRHTFELANNAAGGRSKRRMTEVLWCNF
jgi:hypothetical protein